jgi:homoserine kinase
MRFVIKVPGSTANLGPGFDSIGLAVNLYLTLHVEQSTRWEVIPLSEELEIFPTDESHFIVHSALQVAKWNNMELPPCKIKISSEIPLAKGLGSSAAAIVAAIELANAVGGLNMSKQDKLVLASQMEGHPDNVGPSLYGGLVIGCQTEQAVDVTVLQELQFDLVGVVPNQKLLTAASREVLPPSLSYDEAVKAGAVGNVFVAALMTGDYQLAGKMMKQDRFHQPYRRKLVPHFGIIEKLAEELGAFGVALSGAGPTVMCCVKQGEGQVFIESLKHSLPEMTYHHLSIDQMGSMVYQTVS